MHAIRATGYFLLAFSASQAGANDFAVSPDISSNNFLTYKWSISIDGAGATGNPTLVVMTGQTYSFEVTTNIGHPFWIDQSPGLGGSPGTNPYPVGAALSANGAASNTTITMNLPADAPDALYYACGNHTSMHGTITVVHDLVFRSNFD
jgi:heme/copper-type cytochrome/quinol oxidase subunit 2